MEPCRLLVLVEMRPADRVGFHESTLRRTLVRYGLRSTDNVSFVLLFRSVSRISVVVGAIYEFCISWAFRGKDLNGAVLCLSACSSILYRTVVFTYALWRYQGGGALPFSDPCRKKTVNGVGFYQSTLRLTLGVDRAAHTSAALFLSFARFKGNSRSCCVFMRMEDRLIRISFRSIVHWSAVQSKNGSVRKVRCFLGSSETRVRFSRQHCRRRSIIIYSGLLPLIAFLRTINLV